MQRQTREHRFLKNVLIPMRDGVRLAADIWLPSGEGRYPVILTYLPYHKDGHAGARIMEHLPFFFMKHGYGYAIVDIRGTGSSEGSSSEIYSKQEQEDGYEVVEWLAAQDWCTGSVGMLGWSYGFTSTVLVAAQNPPHLKAIVPFYGNVSLYDAFWEGGSLLAFHFLGYLGSLMVVMNAMPPGFHDVEGRWAKMWADRVENNPPWLLDWAIHQTDDDYWRAKSISPDYERIKAATLAISGWNDVYPTWPEHLYEKIAAPKKLLMGPWLHQEPHKSRVGPRLDYYPILLRWFDRYLKGEENGVEEDPQVLLYTAEYTPPDLLRDPTNPWMNGSWRYEKKLPIARTIERELFLDAGGGLSPTVTTDAGSREYEYDPTVGTAAGLIGGVQTQLGLPIDQRLDELKSVVFSTGPLEEAMEVTGQPRAVLYVSSTAEVAGFSVKLCDGAPDGTTTMISRYYMNATRRDSTAAPSPMKPGEVYRLNIPMNFISYRFLRGHRLKLMVSSADFPHVWPTPLACKNTIHTGRSSPSALVLPVVPAEASIETFQLPQLDAPPSGKDRLIQPDRWRIVNEMEDSSVSVEWTRESEAYPDETTKLYMRWWLRAQAKRGDPSDSRVEASHQMRFTRPGSIVEGRSLVTAQSDERFLHVHVHLEVDYDGSRYARKDWSTTQPRKLW